jgi:hypothetical protein
MNTKANIDNTVLQPFKVQGEIVNDIHSAIEPYAGYREGTASKPIRVGGHD